MAEPHVLVTELRSRRRGPTWRDLAYRGCILAFLGAGFAILAILVRAWLTGGAG